MPDGTHEAIDRFFDLVDHGVDQVERALTRGKRTVEQRARKLPRAVAPVPCKPTGVTALVRKSRLYIVEVVTPSGGTEFVVTDGGKVRTPCPSRSSAEHVLHSLETAQ